MKELKIHKPIHPRWRYLSGCCFIVFLVVVVTFCTIIVIEYTGNYIVPSDSDVVFARKKFEDGLSFRSECVRNTGNKFVIVSLLTTPGHHQEYLQACQVLGKSLIMNGNVWCDVDMVVMIPKDLSTHENIELLMASGWDGVKVFDHIHIPLDILNQIDDLKFRTLFDKLNLFNWVEYDTVLYMDSDTLVVDDIMGLFTDSALQMQVITRPQ